MAPLARLASTTLLAGPLAMAAVVPVVSHDMMGMRVQLGPVIIRRHKLASGMGQSQILIQSWSKQNQVIFFLLIRVFHVVPESCSF